MARTIVSETGLRYREIGRYKSIVNTCLNCGTGFHPRLKAKDQRFCRIECRYEAKMAPMVSIVCRGCGKRFAKKARLSTMRTACSVECRRKVDGTLHVECKRCEKLFMSGREKGRPPRVHCSETCRRPVHLVKCRGCGNDFRATPSRHRSFCSFSCYRAYCGETSIEKAMRECLTRLGLAFKTQVQIGRYSADFVLSGTRLVIEVDGEYWHNAEKDGHRDAYMGRLGWLTLRFAESEIKSAINLDEIVNERVQSMLTSRSPHLHPT